MAPSRQKPLPLCRIASFASFHNAGKEQSQLDDQDERDDELEQIRLRHAGLLDGELIDVVERVELVVDALLPGVEPDASGGEAEEARGVQIAHELDRIFDLIGELVDVDHDRLQASRRARGAAAGEQIGPAWMTLKHGV